MTEHQKSVLLEIWDEYAVSARKVRSVTGMSNAEINRAIQDGRFPLPVTEMNGMNYWRFGDIARLELGWG